MEKSSGVEERLGSMLAGMRPGQQGIGVMGGIVLEREGVG